MSLSHILSNNLDALSMQKLVKSCLAEKKGFWVAPQKQ